VTTSRRRSAPGPPGALGSPAPLDAVRGHERGSARGSHRFGAEAGFTLVEMVVVLLIIALGSALAVPMIEGGVEAREVRRAARQLASTMHFCRGEAVALGEPQELVIDALQNSIHTTAWKRWAVLTDRAVIEDVRGGTGFDSGVVQIIFFPNGSTSGADVVIAGRNDRREHRLRVQLDPLLGTVRVGDAG
jgi:general secretion pathway protein H